MKWPQMVEPWTSIRNNRKDYDVAMSELPDKIKRIDVLRIEYGSRKLCECQNPHYEIDYQNRLVTCSDCNAVVEPFMAIYEIAKHYEMLNSQVSDLLEQRREIANYKPHLVVIKNLERYYRSNNYSMVPCCPRCDEPFDLNELDRWVNRSIANITRREKQ